MACLSELASVRRPPGTHCCPPSARHPTHVPKIRINNHCCQSSFNHNESTLGGRGGGLRTANLSGLLMDSSSVPDVAAARGRQSHGVDGCAASAIYPSLNSLAPGGEQRLFFLDGHHDQSLRYFIILKERLINTGYDVFNQNLVYWRIWFRLFQASKLWQRCKQNR